MESVIVVALISAASGIAGAVIAGAWQRGKMQADADGVKADTNEQIRETVMGLITPLRERIEDLECEVVDLNNWARELVCQVQGLGGQPVAYKRSPRKTKAQS